MIFRLCHFVGFTNNNKTRSDTSITIWIEKKTKKYICIWTYYISMFLKKHHTNTFLYELLLLFALSKTKQMLQYIFMNEPYSCFCFFYEAKNIPTSWLYLYICGSLLWYRFLHSYSSFHPYWFPHVVFYFFLCIFGWESFYDIGFLHHSYSCAISISISWIFQTYIYPFIYTFSFCIL